MVAARLTHDILLNGVKIGEMADPHPTPVGISGVVSYTSDQGGTVPKCDCIEFREIDNGVQIIKKRDP